MAMALVFVRSVVPKQGMVTQMIPRLSRLSMSKALTVTRSASVESRPPEMPMTAVLQLMWRSLCFRPRAWSVRISSLLEARSSESSGTNGILSILLVRFVSPISMSKPM